jgi:hypothetical protein
MLKLPATEEKGHTETCALSGPSNHDMCRFRTSSDEGLHQNEFETMSITSMIQFRRFVQLVTTGECQMPKGNKGLSIERLRALARTGAETTLKELRAEIVAIERTFPELGLPKRRKQIGRSVERAARRTRQMSAAARKAVSQRMKRYWAERRKAKAKVK